MTRMRRMAAGALAGVAAMLIWAVPHMGPGPTPPPPAATGCFLCHDKRTEGPAGMHVAMPCQLCHLGDAQAAGELDAHRGMVVEGAALDVVDETCGLCHAGEVARVKALPMATGRGLIAVDRWAFGEIPTPDGHETFQDIIDVEDPTPGQDHLRRLCLGCHLNTKRENRDDIIDAGTGSGCAACHQGPADGRLHSALPGTPSDDRCFGCHSRSSRIALTYQGLAEVSGTGAALCPPDTVLADERTLCRIPADVHHDVGMACVDCHVHTEIMGDGRTYLHAEQAVEIRCETCHDRVTPRETAVWGDVRDSVTTVLQRLRLDRRSRDERVRTGVRGTPLWNLRYERIPDAPLTDSAWVLYSKASGTALRVTPTPVDVTHRIGGHEDVTCASCHAASAPTCPTCHTTFDARVEQWNFGSGRVDAGAWVETTAGMGTQPPGLAVGADGRILPAIPGMVGEIDARPAGGELRRLHLFSVLDPHSTVKQGRTCRSCHLGEGVFLDGTGTRVGARPLSQEERRRVARVGACLKCHGGTEAWWVGYTGVMQVLDPRHPAEVRRPDERS